MRVLTLLLATAPLLILSAPAPRPEPALAAEVDIVARQGECSNGCTGSCMMPTTQTQTRVKEARYARASQGTWSRRRSGTISASVSVNVSNLEDLHTQNEPGSPPSPRSSIAGSGAGAARARAAAHARKRAVKMEMAFARTPLHIRCWEVATPRWATHSQAATARCAWGLHASVACAETDNAPAGRNGHAVATLGHRTARTRGLTSTVCAPNLFVRSSPVYFIDRRTTGWQVGRTDEQEGCAIPRRRRRGQIRIGQKTGAAGAQLYRALILHFPRRDILSSTSTRSARGSSIITIIAIRYTYLPIRNSSCASTPARRSAKQLHSRHHLKCDNKTRKSGLRARKLDLSALVGSYALRPATPHPSLLPVPEMDAYPVAASPLALDQLAHLDPQMQMHLLLADPSIESAIFGVATDAPFHITRACPASFRSVTPLVQFSAFIPVKSVLPPR
ncbi:hypothetical protein C8Q72DRAFT_794575 [Fomitopsis betulina]|nr:hypothetical protein C8Q72DRAFT_794575 [Fomitopsis betulina]